MGLDLIVEGCAKPGQEQEWRQLLERSFGGKEVSDAEVERFREISIPGYERIGAPRVGRDAAADDWILQAQKAKTPEEIAAVLKEFDGYYVVRLVECDGVPKYSNTGRYEGVDDTSFRGAFLGDCDDVLSRELLSDAWSHKLPDEAVAYGRSLLAAADTAEGEERREMQRRGVLSFLGLAKARADADRRTARNRACRRSLVHFLGRAWARHPCLVLRTIKPGLVLVRVLRCVATPGRSWRKIAITPTSPNMADATVAVNVRSCLSCLRIGRCCASVFCS